MAEWEDRLDEWELELELSAQLDGSQWVTLERAAADTGVSRAALRNWYRTGQLPSRLVDGPHGPQRLVPLAVVAERAEASPRLRKTAERRLSDEAQLEILRHRVDQLELRLAELERKHDKDWVTVGGIITETKRIRTRNGDHMMFATLDDLEGTVELLVFGKALAEHEQALHCDQVVLVRGRVDHKEAGSTCLIVQSVEPYNPDQQELERARASLPAEALGEASAFLRWLEQANFTFLGARSFELDGDSMGDLEPLEGTGLGVLRDPNVQVLRRGTQMVAMTPEVRGFFLEPAPLIITKANVVSRVHRRAHMDYIGIKIYHADGTPKGETRIVGLFTSQAYVLSPSQIPFLRHKVASVLAASGFPPASHDGGSSRGT